MTNAEARCNKSLRPRKPEGSLGRTAQDVYLDSHTAPELCFTSTETVGLLRTGRRGYGGGGMDFHTAPELWTSGLAFLSPSRQSARVARAYLL